MEKYILPPPPQKKNNPNLQTKKNAMKKPQNLTHSNSQSPQNIHNQIENLFNSLIVTSSPPSMRKC